MQPFAQLAHEVLAVPAGLVGDGRGVDVGVVEALLDLGVREVLVVPDQGTAVEQKSLPQNALGPM